MLLASQALGRLFTIFLQYSGHTCGIEDLTLNSKAEVARRRLIDEVMSDCYRRTFDVLPTTTCHFELS